MVLLSTQPSRARPSRSPASVAFVLGSSAAKTISTPIRRGVADCCACAASGHAAAALPTSEMNSRRLMGRPKAKDKPTTLVNESCVLRHSKFGLSMSALGQKRTSRQLERMSALPSKADIGTDPNSSGSLATLAVIRRASSLLSSLSCKRCTISLTVDVYVCFDN